jgi:glycosyltransferase involved in cell wall biosynthesis
MQSQSPASVIDTAELEQDRSSTKPDVSVVVPCLNESKTLRPVIECVTDAFKRYGVNGEVIVANNGSTDNSKEIALECGARVVDIAQKGYGSALIGGIQAARGEFVIFGDADNTYDFMEIDRFIQSWKNGYEFVMGTRLKGHIEEKAMPDLHRYFGTPILTMLINFFFKTRISDCNCGLRGFTKGAFAEMDVHSTGMEFASEMIIKAGLLKLKMTEVPVTLRVDLRGRLPHLRTWQDGWRHLRFIIAYATDQILLAPGLFSILIGVIGMVLVGRAPTTVYGFHMDYHFLFPSALCIILGTQLILFTFLSKTYTGLAKYDLKFKRLGRHINVEVMMIFGILLFLVGLGINANIMMVWLRNYGHELFAVRPAVIAVTLMATGAQIFFNAFFIGVLEIPQRLNIE